MQWFRTFILSLVLLPSLLMAQEKPNIILIFVDDMGYGDLACYGNSKTKTPNIDRLAAEGQRWTSFYSSGSSCVPSRTGLMSGRHPNLLADQPLRNDPTALMPMMLKRQGYATGMLGKWHLAGYPKDFTTTPMHPLDCGFDEHLGTPGSNDAPGPPLQTREAFDNATPHTWKIPLIRGREIVEFPANQELLTKRYTEEAVSFINRHAAAASENGTTRVPFFLYLAHNMPHAPVFASPSFQGRSAGGRFGDVVEEIDWSVGEVMKAVLDNGLDEQTLIVFTSDNGPWTVFGPHGGTALPLRGEKATTWEGGLRVPGIFRWPGKISPGIVDGMAANLDLYATFAALTGGVVPQEKPGYMSQDLTSTLLKGEPSPRSWWLYHDSAFRQGKYKIHTQTHLPTDPVARKRTPKTTHDPPLLYDLEADISEQTDIASQHPEVVAELLDLMHAHLRGQTD
ncbi:MAG: sulfatase-like hydrolase/transferase [Planctomycetales bacterium]|nr:sulfatase-like hydrolase/transferase [Planctomycetales bacterium]